jgi:uncharacterized membrane protein
VLRLSLTLFVFAFTFSLAALARIGETVPQIAIWIAVGSSIASIALFLYMLDRVGKSLRPVIFLTKIGSLGQEVIDDVYPRHLGEGDAQPPAQAPTPGVPARVVAAVHTGVVLAFDIEGLAELARRAEGVIEFVPQVGNFIASGDPLFRLHGGAAAIEDRAFQQSVAIGAERTMEQDPAFAFRIIVDIGREGAVTGDQRPDDGRAGTGSDPPTAARRGPASARHRPRAGCRRPAAARLPHA